MNIKDFEYIPFWKLEEWYRRQCEEKKEFGFNDSYLDRDWRTRRKRNNDFLQDNRR